jgi:hypothetical protein
MPRRKSGLFVACTSILTYNNIMDIALAITNLALFLFAAYQAWRIRDVPGMRLVRLGAVAICLAQASVYVYVLGVNLWLWPYVDPVLFSRAIVRPLNTVTVSWLLICLGILRRVANV